MPQYSFLLKVADFIPLILFNMVFFCWLADPVKADAGRLYCNVKKLIGELKINIFRSKHRKEILLSHLVTIYSLESTVSALKEF